MSKRDHGDGGIDERGPNRYRLRWRVDGKRFSKSFHGSISEARKELRRLIKSADDGVHIAPAKLTIAQYLREWLNTEPVIGAKGKILSPKTLERYRQLRDEQIIPHLGSTLLQSLKPVQVHGWHSDTAWVGRYQRPPVGTAYRWSRSPTAPWWLRKGGQTGTSNTQFVHAVHPPEVDDDDEVVILTKEQIADVLNREEHPLHAIVALALGSGMRRGELCALPWSCLDLNKAQVRVERSLEQTKGGLRFKAPKTKNSRRTITLARSTVEVLRAHRRQQLEQRMLLGIGKLGDHDLVFGRVDGSPYPPNTLSRDWWRARLVPVEFHALRHTHASALIAAGIDVVTVSKRLGHSSPAITLKIYAHLFRALENDTRSAEAIERMFRG